MASSEPGWQRRTSSRQPTPTDPPTHPPTKHERRGVAVTCHQSFHNNLARQILCEGGRGKYVDCICIRQTITIKINCFCFTAPCCQFTSVDSAGSVKIATTTRSERTDSNLFQQNVLGHNWYRSK